jgi:hypothetical protein
MLRDTHASGTCTKYVRAYAAVVSDVLVIDVIVSDMVVTERACRMQPSAVRSCHWMNRRPAADPERK